MKIKSYFRFCLHAVALCTVFSPFCSFASVSSVACAEADAVRYTLTLEAVHGTVSGSGDYESGASVPLSCILPDNLVFDGWYDGTTKVSGSPSFNYTMPSGNVRLEVKYRIKMQLAVMYNLALNKGEGISSVSGGGSYQSGKTVLLSCTVSGGYTFDGWYEGDTKKSSSASYSHTVSMDVTLTAKAVTTCMEYTYDASGNRTARKLKSSTSALRSETLTGGNGYEEEHVLTGHEKTASLFPEVKITTRYNSTEETLHVDIFGGSIPSKTRTELHNLSGQLVEKWEIVSESNTLDISAHPAGPYLVFIYSGNRHVSTLKIVKR
ncbi:hypothetical protein Barb6XT_02152 [Bacteroidales bacterium Barb6XT]|nr:hypothetical protein Barb6XT_02152 [Bacteroidales bacterium Barb6XT]